MLTKREYYLAAQHLIEQYGANAQHYAHRHVLKLMKQGATNAAYDWINITQCIRDLMQAGD